MCDTLRLLEQIEEGIVHHGEDLAGWTRLTDKSLQLFDGQVTLTAQVHEDDQAEGGHAHCHVFATLHEYDDEVLDACVFGLGDDRGEALEQAAMIWVSAVAGPIKSFLENEPVCMACKAGVQGGNIEEGYAPGDYGLTGVRAFVGPSISRAIDSEDVQDALDDSKPWFRYATESAAPRRVHLAKSTVFSNGTEGWQRSLEIDGHEVTHHDPNWPAGVEGPEFGYLTRFAVFEFPRNSTAIARRRDLDRTIHEFARRLAGEHEVDAIMTSMEQDGFDANLVHEAEAISTIAFGRTYFEHHGIQYSNTIIRARGDGRIEKDVALMSIPAFSRGRAAAAKLRQTMSEHDFQTICLYNAESQAILQALEQAGDTVDLSKMSLFPSVVPDRNTPAATMNAAVAALEATIRNQETRNRSSTTPAKRKPWWKFW